MPSGFNFMDCVNSRTSDIHQPRRSLAGLGRLIGPMLVLIAILSSAMGNVSYGQSKSSKPEKKAPDSAVVRSSVSVPVQPGYLSKTAPSGLRFAAPPKPPVTTLPPLPISYNPQPMFTPEFAEPLGELPVPPSPPAPPPVEVPTPVPFTDLVSTLANKAGKIPGNLPRNDPVLPHMLVKFFNGKLADTQFPSERVSFQPPVTPSKPTSTATYNVNERN